MIEDIRLYKKNIKFLKKNKPEIYELLHSARYDTSYDIQIKSDKKILVIEDHEVSFSEKDIQCMIEEISQRRRQRMINIKIHFDKDLWSNSYHYEMLRNIDTNYQLYKEEIVQINHFPVFILYGVGFGFHIMDLVKKFKIYNLILVEHDISLIRPSLYFLDWEQLCKMSDVSIVCARDYKILAQEIHKKIKEINELYVQYLESFITYPSELFFQTKQYLEDKVHALGNNWGFFDDEYMALDHTLKNISFTPSFYVKKRDVKEYPVFIVGSGPSLDDTIEDIQRLADKAAIFACGTALAPLLEHGIVPDYEFILERTRVPYEAFVMYKNKNILKNIDIIGVNLIYPEFYKNYKTRMVLRGSDSGSLLFDEEFRVLLNTGPTVTNLAFSFALSLGFKEIYLFGIDLGIKGEKHHAKSTIYYTSKQFDIQKDYPIEVESVKGETIWTNTVMYQSKLMFEQSIKVFKDRYVYNCSNGAMIEGAYFVDSKELNFANTKKDISYIEQNFEKDFFTREKKAKILANFEEMIQGFTLCRRYFTFILFRHVESIDDIYQNSNRFYQQMMRNFKKPGVFLFTAAIFHQLSYLLLTLYGIDDKKKVAYFKKNIKEIIKYLEKLEKLLQTLKYERLDSIIKT